ncbi:MAG: hypothetical protein ACKVVT_05390 [Dehalococcoidia bacterium]
MTPVQDRVRFEVTVTFRQNTETGRWLAQTLQTGLITLADSQEEAERLNGLANVKLVRWWKSQGEAVLRSELKARRVPFGFALPGASAVRSSAG